MKKTTLFIAISIAAFAYASPAQNTRETLTNKSIVDLVRLGLSETLIVTKINQSVCQCDTTTDALSKLTAARVSEKIIMAMMNSSSGEKPYSESGAAGNSSQKAVAGSKNGPGASELSEMAEPGIYLSEDGKIAAIEPTVYSGSKTNFFASALTYGIKKAKIRAVVRGKSANLQVNDARPVFYFLFSREHGNSGAVMSGFGGYAATSPNEFMMISMKVKENSREAVLGEIGIFSASSGASDKDIREFSFEKIRPGLYKVTPKTDLSAGEYCLYYAGTSGAGNKVFDFGVK